MSLIQRLRQALAASALEAGLRAVGLGRPLLALHERRALAQGQQQVSAFGARPQFLTRTRAELTRIDMVGLHERDFTKRLLDSLRRDDVLYDVGSNIGVLATLAALRLDRLGGGQVLAIEPNPETADTATRNLALNGFTPAFTSAHPVSARVIAAALADQPGEGRLRVIGDPAEGNDRLTDRQDPAELITVAIQLGDALARQTQSWPSIMKVDVEGAELRVMRGFSETLARGQLREVFIEVHPTLMRDYGDDVGDLFAWMTRMGYESRWCSPRGSEVHHQFVRGTYQAN